jgi:ParB/RepB/Spo0J family partition protein
MTAAAEVSAQVQMIALNRLDENPLNPRKSFDKDAMEGLEQSIHAIGITQPLLVRPGQSDERFEIVAGHRRLRAAQLVGLIAAPCIVRELTDAEAADIALIDNLQREDVGALEEAEAFAALLERHGSIDAVAARVGKDLGYVAKRLKLQSLSLAACDAVNERLITVDHALLLARLGADEQDAALKWTLDTSAGVKISVGEVIKTRLTRRKNEDGDTWRKWEPESAMRLKEHIEQSTGRKLSRAPWDLDDAELLPDAGACSSCQSNTKANMALFADLAIEEATCADGACFEAKRAEYVLCRIREVGSIPPTLAAKNAVKVGHPQVVRTLELSWKESSSKPAICFNDMDAPGMMAQTANPAKVLRHGQWVEAKKGSCPNVRTGITVDWSDDANRGYMGGCEKLRKPGEALLVCAAVGCKAHPKAYEQKTSTGTGKRDEAAAKAAEEKRKAEAIAESKLRLAVASKALEGITALPIEAVRVVAQRALPAYRGNHAAFNALIPGIMKILQTAPADSAEFARAVAAASIEANYLTANDWQPATFCRKEFLAEIKRLGYDGAAAWKQPKKAKPKKAAAKPAAKKAASSKGRKLSPEAKKRIVSATKKRWAQKKAQAKPADPGGGEP